jgi:hypothetical protein
MNTLVNETLDVKTYFAKELSSCYNDQARTNTAFPIEISEKMEKDAGEIHSVPISGLYELAPCSRNITGSITNNVLCSIQSNV